MLFPKNDISSIQRRFEEKYIPEPNSGCWLWMACLSKKGYGELMMRHSKRVELAHRISYNLFHGEIGNNHVLHKCDNPCCVNPEHLEIGSHKKNMEQMADRGRAWMKGRKGSLHPQVKITREIADKIKQDRRPSRSVAAQYNLSHTHVLYIRKGIHWN